MDEREEHVRQMLREAFADVPCPDAFKELDACCPVEHSVALELRLDFYNYEPDEIQYMLPSILEDLMDTRTGDDIETEDAERLILQLNPFRHNNEVSRENQTEQFANFSPKQAQAVCEWLRLARTWEDLKRFVDWVDAAIDYWCHRASNEG
jgi:hypothetical protein